MLRSFLVAVVAAATLVSAACKSDDKPTTHKADPTSFIDDTHGTNMHVQTPAQLVGGELVVASVHLAAPGYVGVLEDKGGAPGRPVGATKLLKKGTTRNLHIAIKIPNGSSTKIVWVVVNREDNGNKTYDYPNGDMPFEGNTGVLALKVDLKS